MKSENLITMSKKELERYDTINKVIEKRLTQPEAASIFNQFEVFIGKISDLLPELECAISERSNQRVELVNVTIKLCVLIIWLQISLFSIMLMQ